jgi:hypothetical protein
MVLHLDGSSTYSQILDKVKSSSLFASKAREEEKNAYTDNCWIKFE